MFITRNDLQRIKRVEINRLENHLRAAGWTLDELQNDWRRRAWNRLGFSVDVPAWGGFIDYHRRIADVVATLTHVEDRYPDDILDDLLREEES